MTPAFKKRVEEFGPRFQADLGLQAFHVAGMFGNFAVETGQFKYMQEIAPTVKGSAGGVGWAQWTGRTAKNPRRRDFEMWCASNGFSTHDDEASYRYVVVELKGSEKAALAALKKTKTVDSATEIFMLRYERPGVPHLDKRKKYALEALQVLEGTTTVAQPSRRPAKWAEEELARFEVEAIQKRLRELGWFQVGKVDGHWGPSTAGALMAMQAQAGITADGHYGPETKAALADESRSRREVSDVRKDATAKDLREQGSTIAIEGRRVTWASVASVAVIAFDVIRLMMQNYDPNASLPWPMSMVTGFLPPGVMMVLPMLLNLYNALAAKGIVGARVEAERTGLHNGEPDPAPSPPVKYGPDGSSIGGFLGGLFGRGS